MTTAAIVLAAGSGSRFAGETPKLLARLRGRPLAAWAITAAAAAGLDDVFVVSGAVDLGPLDLPARVTMVANPDYRDGQSSSVLAGLAAAEAERHAAVVIGLADQPFVPAAAWQLVAATTVTPIAVATYSGRRRNPVRFAAAVWPLLRDALRGDEGARRVLALRPDLVTEVGCPGDPTDIDTLEDLNRWNS